MATLEPLSDSARGHVTEVGPLLYLDIHIGAAPAGRIVIQTRADVAPMTCTNFIALCTGEYGVGPMTGKVLTYKGTRFHRVTRDFCAVGGDFERGDGTGGECVPFKHAKDGRFPDENFVLRHAGPYVLSMHNTGPDTNGSMFYLMFSRSPMLDDKHVVFGYVLKGHEVVDAIDAVGTPSGRPMREVEIVDCGRID